MNLRNELKKLRYDMKAMQAISCVFIIIAVSVLVATHVLTAHASTITVRIHSEMYGYGDYDGQVANSFYDVHRWTRVANDDYLVVGLWSPIVAVYTCPVTLPPNSSLTVTVYDHCKWSWKHLSSWCWCTTTVT